MSRFAFPLTLAIAGLCAVPAIAQDEATLLARAVCTAVAADDINELDKAVGGGASLPTIACGEQSLISIAAVRASPDVLEYLAREDVDIDRADGRGYTPIMRALEQGRVDNALKLRDLGASLEGVTSDGYTVRVLAELVGLDDFGPEPPRPALLSQELANELLLRAAEFGDVESVRLALDSNADVSVKAGNGWSAVMVAALGGHADIVELLAERGALGTPDEPLDTVGDHVDAVVAALVGKGNGDIANVSAVLAIIAQYKDLSEDGDLYRAVAGRQGYAPEFLDRLLPPNDLPPLEIVLPHVNSNDSWSWSRVQENLRELELYQGASDGNPGSGTLSALYGYVEAFEEPLLRRALTAMRRAENLQKATGRASSNGYGNITWDDRDFLGQVQSLSGESVGAGYFAQWIFPKRPTDLDIEFGYFDPQEAGAPPVLRGRQTLEDDGTLKERSLSLSIAGGLFSIVREPHVTIFGYTPRGGKGRTFRRQEANEALAVEPLPGADLMERPTQIVQPEPPTTGAQSVIIDASEFEEDDPPVIDGAGGSDDTQLSPMDRLQEALEK